METWAAIPGYEGLYEVSDLGRVRSLRNGSIRLLSPGGFPGGKVYLKVSLTLDGKARCYLIHRLVLLAFVGPCPPGQETRHLNGDGRDNRLTNLRYGTHRENHADKERLGRQARGEAHHRAKLTEEQVVAIRRIFKTRWGRPSYEKAGMEYGVGERCIRDIVKRKTWTQVR